MITADSRQWMICEFRAADGAWIPQKFICDRDHLLDRIGEMCGKVAPEALAEVRAWPKRHSTWYRLRTGRPTPSIAIAAGGAA